MRRLLLIFMMVLLPLQWSWAAAASVCEHEGRATHFGHHEHEHDAVDQAADKSASEKSDGTATANHPDCQACHGMAAYPAARLATANLWAEGGPSFAYAQFLPDPPIQSFLRPPFSLVA